MATLEEVGAKIERYSGVGPHYQLVEGSVALDQVCRAIVTVRSHLGIPLAGVRVTDEWPGGRAILYTNAAGQAEFFFGPEAKFWPPDTGPHKIYVGRPGEVPSDEVVGLGLPNGHHADYQLTFQYVLDAEGEEGGEEWKEIEFDGKLWGVVPVRLTGKVRVK